jgi:predicted membrane chloride channel (bestrophin family)
MGGDNSVPQLPAIGTTSFLFLLELILSELLFYFLTVFEWSLFGTPGIHLEIFLLFTTNVEYFVE